MTNSPMVIRTHSTRLARLFLTSETSPKKKKVKFMNIHDLTQVDMVNYSIGGNVEIIFIQFSLEKIIILKTNTKKIQDIFSLI